MVMFCFRINKIKEKGTDEKLTLLYKMTTLDEFTNYFKPKFQHFVKHNFVAREEDKQFKACIGFFIKLTYWFT